MPSAEIGNVIIKGNKAGMAYGGYIYSVNINIGNSTSPTKLTINVVHKQGINEKTRENIKKNIDELDLISIKIGDLNNIHMYLTSYQIRKNLGSNLMTLEYIDGSILLDKIQVCLTERQYAVESQNKLYSNASGSIKEEEADFEVTPICNACDGSGEMVDKSKYSAYDVKQNSVTCEAAGGEWDADTETCNFSVKREIKYASDSSHRFSEAEEFPFFYVPSYPSVLKREGGLLVIGRENFVENNCDVPDVDYTFSDLLRAFGVGDKSNNQYITVKNDSLKDRTKDSNEYSSYRRSYSGTLREVLNSWCSDFAYSFTWDIFSESPQIIGIDLTQNVGGSKIDDVKALVDSIKLDDAKDNSTVVESTTESYSKEGSYQQSYISQYLKPAKTKNKTSKKYVKKLFYNVPLELITTDGIVMSAMESTYGQEYTTREWGSRRLTDQITSSAIGKYSKEARLSFLWGRATNPNYIGRSGCARVLGYTFPGVNEGALNTNTQNAIIAEWTEDRIHDIITKFGDDFVLKFAYYNEEQRTYWEGWDEQVCDFIGRFYFKPIVDGELNEKGVITKAAFENVTRMVAGQGEVKAYPFRKGHENQDASNFPWARFVKAGESHQLHKIFPYLRARETVGGYSQQGMPTDGEGKSDFFVEDANGNLTLNTAKYNENDSNHYKSDNPTYKNGIWAFERDAHWGTTQEEADMFLRTVNGSNMMANFVPENIPLDGRALMIFQEFANKSGSDQISILQNSNIVPVLVAGPSSGRCAQMQDSVHGGALGFIGTKQINDAIFSKRYFNETYTNFNEQVSHAISDIGSGGDRASDNSSKSTTMCEASTVEELCGICGFEDYENRPTTGFPYFQYMRKVDDPSGEEPFMLIPSGTICEAFGLKKVGTEASASGASFLRIILPCQLDYVGYLEISYNSRQTIEGVSKVFGSPLPLKRKENGVMQTIDDYKNKTLGIKLIENNITNDADSSLFDDDQERILNIFVPNGFDPASGTPLSKGITAQQYHDEIKKYFDSNNLGIDLPRQQYGFSIAGLNFSKVKGDGKLKNEEGEQVKLSELLKPEKGWSTMAITYGDKGITTNLSFETRPAILANPQIFMKHLGPKLNTFR